MTSEGLDCSKWQSTINWPRASAAGKSFAWIKATEGTGYADPYYWANRTGCIRAGVARGAYHFAQPYASASQPPDKDGREEADWFLATARVQPGDLLPVLDLEVSNGLSVAALIAWVTSFVARVHEVIGQWPVIYTSPSFWSTHLGDSAFAAALGCRLWIAHWGVSSPAVPASDWGHHGWSVWQYTSDGSVPGIRGRVDLDRAPSLAPLTLGGDMAVLTLTVLPFGGGEARIAPGDSVVGLRLDAQGHVSDRVPFTAGPSGSMCHYDATADLSQLGIRGAPFVRVIDGPMADTYLGGSGVAFVPNPPPLTQADIDVAKAAVKKAALEAVEGIDPK